MANVMPKRPPDALKIYPGWLAKGGKSGSGRRAQHLSVQAEFGPLFGGARLWNREQGDHIFTSPRPTDTLLFPIGHDREKESRYVWLDRGDGVEYGYLVDGASHDDHLMYSRPELTEEDVRAARIASIKAMVDQGIMGREEADPMLAELGAKAATAPATAQPQSPQAAPAATVPATATQEEKGNPAQPK